MKIGSRYFAESACTFGCSSSPSIFDQLAELVLLLVLAESECLRSEALRMLDDNVMVNEPATVQRWMDTFIEVAKACDIKLAPFGGDKAFAPCSRGTILGMTFDLPSWTFWLEETKVQSMLALLFEVWQLETVPETTVESLNGKLSHYFALLGPDGVRERAFLLHLAPIREGDPVTVTEPARSQARFWIDRLTVLLDPANANKIPDPRLMVPCSSLCLYPDATGWGGGQAGRGYGAVAEVNSELILTSGAWPVDWSSPARDSMITLEGIAALAGLVMICPLVAGQSVVIKTDNKSLAMAYSKGHSRSELASSVILALYRLARARAISLAIEWTPRCSSDFTIAADCLSRGLVNQAISRLPALPSRWGTRSKTLEKFISGPLPTRLLGQAIATELPCETLSWSLESSEDLWSLM